MSGLGVVASRNRHRVPGSSWSPDSRVLTFHEGLPDYDPTPLHSLDGLARDLGVRSVQVKDEGKRFGLNAFKVLGASWAAHRLLATRRPSCLTTASAGNFGRAVAWTARHAGIDAVIYLPRDTAPARVSAIEGEGAAVVLVDGPYDEAVRQCDKEAKAFDREVLTDVGYVDYLEIPAWIQEGYSTIPQEIAQQWSDVGPDIVIIQGGVGGIASAMTRAYSGHAKIVVVEPTSADCLRASAVSEGGMPTPTGGNLSTRMAGLNCRYPCLVAWPALRDGVDLFLALDDRWTEEAMRVLWSPVGGDPRIEAGESGAAGLAALLALRTPTLVGEAEWLGLDEARVLVVVTEGATDPEHFISVVNSSSDIPGPRSRV